MVCVLFVVSVEVGRGSVWRERYWGLWGKGKNGEGKCEKEEKNWRVCDECLMDGGYLKWELGEEGLIGR